MPYISRDPFNNIAGIFEHIQPGFAEEYVDGSRPSVNHFPNNGVWVLSPKTIQEIRAEMQCASWQLRRALTELGLRAAVEAAVAAADQDTKDMWEYATVYHRNHPIVSALAASINKTDADIDALFELAITIQE